MKNIIIITIFSVSLGLFFVYKTSSYFNDTEISVSNSFAAASDFGITPTIIITPTETPTPTNEPTSTPTPTPTQIPEQPIVINEVYSEGAEKKEWVELYNPNNYTINITGWLIADETAFGFISGGDVLPTFTIGAHGFGVIVTSDTDVIVDPSIKIQLTSSDIGAGLNNGSGGDAVYLRKPDKTVVDSMSFGTNIFVYNPGPDAPSASQTISRIPNGFDSDTVSDWQIDDSPTLGTTNAL